MKLAEDRQRSFLVLDKEGGGLFDSKDDGRNRQICAAFERVRTRGQAAADAPNAQLFPVYWLLKDGADQERASAGELRDSDKIKKRCRRLVENYSLPAGRRVAEKANLPRKSTAYLVAFDNQDRSFYIDIDDGDDAELDNVMNAWFEIAAENSQAPGVTILDWETKIVKRLCSVVKAPGGAAAQVGAKIMEGIIYRDGECTVTFAS